MSPSVDSYSDSGIDFWEACERDLAGRIVTEAEEDTGAMVVPDG
jgi:hypothetical protein